MKNKKYLYTSGEFAKLTGVNKRTLHYYNDIGLFCPKIIKENGYHYYTCFQFAQLELILTLRKMGLSIEEIKDYVDETSDQSFVKMMDEKRKMIDDSIKELLTIQNFLELKSKRIRLGFSACHGEIELCQLPERRIIRSSKISGRYDENDFSIAAEFSLRLKNLFHLYDNFGSMIPIEEIKRQNFDGYDYFFAYCPQYSEVVDEILPAGTYLRAYCIGEWNRLPDVYQRIIEYAEKHGLSLMGHAYEEGLNEMTIKNQSDYVTMITIHCKKE